MATTYTYTGQLTDFGDTPFPDAIPRLWVEPKRDAFTPDGLGAARRIPVVLPSSGLFEVELIASIDLVPPTQYSFRADWFTTDVSGTEVLAGWSQWDFTAQPGGGPIATMPGVLTRVWYSQLEPPVNRAGIYWINPVTDEVKEWR